MPGPVGPSTSLWSAAAFHDSQFLIAISPRCQPLPAATVRVVKGIHDGREHAPNLRFVAAHEQCILEGILAHLPDLRQIFVQDLEFLFAGYDASVRLLPFDWVALPHKANVSVISRGASADPRQEKQNAPSDVFLQALAPHFPSEDVSTHFLVHPRYTLLDYGPFSFLSTGAR